MIEFVNFARRWMGTDTTPKILSNRYQIATLIEDGKPRADVVTFLSKTGKPITHNNFDKT